LTLFLIVLWLALVGHLKLGSLLLGALLGIAIPLVTRTIWSEPPKISSAGRLLVYCLVVAWDVAVANLQVAWLIVFRSNQKMRPCWITIPLDLKSSEAIAVLAGTITLTPGTVSCELSSDGGTLLVHCLDAAEPNREVARIKKRYESRLGRIFS
jgi:multicomponent K+:H+ antiporter subunit E